MDRERERHKEKEKERSKDKVVAPVEEKPKVKPKSDFTELFGTPIKKKNRKRKIVIEKIEIRKGGRKEMKKARNIRRKTKIEKERDKRKKKRKGQKIKL